MDDAAVIAKRNKSIAEQIDAIKNDKDLAMRRTVHSSAMYDLERKSAKLRSKRRSDKLHGQDSN